MESDMNPLSSSGQLAVVLTHLKTPLVDVQLVLLLIQMMVMAHTSMSCTSESHPRYHEDEFLNEGWIA